jgi:hypothetical protein
MNRQQTGYREPETPVSRTSSRLPHRNPEKQASENQESDPTAIKPAVDFVCTT